MMVESFGGKIHHKGLNYKRGFKLLLNFLHLSLRFVCSGLPTDNLNSVVNNTCLLPVCDQFVCIF